MARDKALQAPLGTGTSYAMSEVLTLAVVGDVHLHFNQRDVEYFNNAGYAALIFTGDLINYRGSELTKVTDAIQQLRVPSFIIPGNHDCGNVFQLVAELFQSDFLRAVTSIGHTKYEDALRRTIGSVCFTGYSSHPLCDGDVELVAVRPYSMGGPRLSFGPHLRKHFNVASLEASMAKLETVIDKTTATDLIFLGHNGPSGLGTSRSDIWGCDFKKDEGDFGDPDFEHAIRYARAQGKRVRAVIGGHMHRWLKGGGERCWNMEREGTLYVNAANVPRIRKGATHDRHHHIELAIGDHVTCTEHWVDISH